MYEFIRTRNDYPAAKWVKYLRISRSGYYDYIRRRESREKEDNARKHEIKRIFDDSGGTYGPDRINGILRRNGQTASYRKTRGYMDEMGLKSVHTKHKTKSLTNSKKARDDSKFPNYVRNMTIFAPRQAVCSDITYLKCGEGWLYLCTVKDIFTGELLGHSMSDRMTENLVIQAFLNAQGRHKLPRGIIFHSDRGSQYTSKNFMETLRMYGITQSFSRIGKPGDNAWAESFFATLKKECIHFNQFATRDQLRYTVFAWIEGFYNTKRVQARLGYCSPREYNALFTAKWYQTPA